MFDTESRRDSVVAEHTFRAGNPFHLLNKFAQIIVEYRLALRLDAHWTLQYQIKLARSGMFDAIEQARLTNCAQIKWPQREKACYQTHGYRQYQQDAPIMPHTIEDNSQRHDVLLLPVAQGAGDGHP